MGKKNKSNSSLGRSLIKDKFSGRKHAGDSSMLHTAELADGYDWGRLNLQSVTEENSFEEFLSTANLAGTEFLAEKLNLTFVNPSSNVEVISEEERKDIIAKQEENKQFLQIPRRPNWDEKTSPEELHSLEKDAFLDWRRKLALFQDENNAKGLLLTPYEKNIEFWRQLWRVVEKSDVVIQIVDARNPLLFRCEDLERYVQEVAEKQGSKKINFILVNKADFLTKSQRETWCEYFNSQNVRVAFFSAIKYSKQTAAKETEIPEVDEDVSDEASDVSDSLDGSPSADTQASSGSAGQERVEEISRAKSEVESSTGTLSEDNQTTNEKAKQTPEGDTKNSSDILTREELVSLLKGIAEKVGENSENKLRTLGMVGYPNVGKSSTINALVEEKKTSVSATPGKTKHFQTLFLEEDLVLCDCPGLVMPSFVSSQAEMVLWGILPVDRLRDHVPSVSLLAALIPKHSLEEQYSIMLPSPMEGEDPDRPPTSEELLNSYGYMRGFMTPRGIPDNARGARYVLKDFVNGRLLYCRAPPGYNQDEFHVFPSTAKSSKASESVSSSIAPSKLPPQLRMARQNKFSVEALDNAFFRKASIGVHTKGTKPAQIGGAFPGSSQEASNLTKPWKKHNNKNKKEKLRRVYSYLDQ
ncbi:hypothetical protein J437_LFUL011766 [Ladona fulva]|uniref:Large subunit GTPase 1 homolog n=1 Tax=Ladona fulva TaxID=123851 RepID=A0A8K0P334_LADFU|nr:hypothetical protein J437_LFUL011766 [Ladona fulva]